MPSSSFVITGAVRTRPLVQRAVVGRMRYLSYQPPNPPSSNSSGGTAAKNPHVCHSRLLFLAYIKNGTFTS